VLKLDPSLVGERGLFFSPSSAFCGRVSGVCRCVVVVVGCNLKIEKQRSTHRAHTTTLPA
jgi:hypothetical protein